MPRPSQHLSSSLASGSPLVISMFHQASPTRFRSNGFCVLLLARGLGQGSRSTHLRNRKLCMPSPRRFQTLSLWGADTAPNAAFSLPVDNHAPSRSSSNQMLARNNNLDLANDKVENWTSRAYAHLPFQPDFTLFEAIDEADEDPCPNRISESTSTLRQTQLSTALCDRLVHLIESDDDAANELKSEIIKNSIDLPSNKAITTYCFDRLLKYQDIQAYLDWLPLVSSCHLQQTSLVDHGPLPAAEIHLNAILKIAHTDLATLSQFVNALVFKQCFTKHVGFTIIKHLVRTQSPSTTIVMMNKICDMTKSLPISSEVNNALHDFLVLQLANQGHLSKALDLLLAKTDDPNDPTSSTRAIYPLTYQVLADQLMSKMKQIPPQSQDHQWSAQLDKLIACWYMDDRTSLGRWLTPTSTIRLNALGLPALTKRISKQYTKNLSAPVASNLRCHSPSTETLQRLSTLFNSLLDQNHHPKFLKAAQVANELNRLLPLQDSFEHLRSELGSIYPYKSGETDERYIKSIVFAGHQLGSMQTASKSPSSSSSSKHTPILLRPDVMLLWSHSWMIFCQRSGQPSRAIDIFFDYFVPIGCDLDLFNQIRSRPLRSSGTLSRPPGSVGDQRHQTLIHPTTGVLTVLYDALLSLCPPKLVPLVFKSFLAQHYRQPAWQSNTGGHQNDGAYATARLEPNFSSFRPFVRAFLRHGNVTSSLSALQMMHSRCKPCGVSDEGGWIDLLEWCASHSAGPRPNAGAHSSTWGSQRKKKINGWDGKMKEQLVYSVLQRFLRSSTPAAVDRNFLEADGQINPIGLLPPSAVKGDAWIKAHLDAVDWDILNDGPATYSHRFPTSKLLHRVKSGFSRAGHRRGIKIMDRLIDWRER